MSALRSRKRSLEESGLQSPPDSTKRARATSSETSSSTSSLDTISDGSGSSSDDDDADSEDIASATSSTSSEGESDLSENDNHSESTSDSDSDSSSSSSSSSDARSRQATPLTTLPLAQKPAIQDSSSGVDTDLASRLASFLPEMAAANASLEDDRAAGRLQDRQLENVENDEEGYIEMNLGLGVLEDKDPDADGTSSSSDESSNEDGETTGEPEGNINKVTQKERDIMGRLMGGRNNTRPNIEEIGHT
ncbi:MAG: hypothetical protein M1827_001510 [Pycnora praestabilis]|nr:MAG: hypothetical protein M1827_001510 [Pycnora praestabilis]